MLWRFLTITPCDYSGFDRRFIYRGMYLDELTGGSIKVRVSIDTSGSIADSQLEQFMAELSGILGAYPHITCELYYADTALYGPYSIENVEDVPAAVGGGGTSFIPFFDYIDEAASADKPELAIYLTDGYGEFPAESRSVNVLWVVVPGGEGNHSLPFGEVARLI